MAMKLKNFAALALLLCMGVTATHAQSSPNASLRGQLRISAAPSNPARVINGRLTNLRGETFEVARPARFTGAFVNHGKFKSTDTTVTFADTYTENGAFLSDPSTNIFTDLNVGANGYLSGGVGDRFIVTGNFANASTQNVAWSTAAAELSFSGGTAHAMSLAGADRGPTFTGYVNNFAWGILRLAPGQSLILSDGNATPGAAFYAEQLIIEGGLPQIAAITGNGFNIYYDPLNAANAYLNAGTYPLAGGGSIKPVGVVLKITSITRLPNTHILLQCLGVPSRNHTIAASPDLIAPFNSIATALAAPDGTFQFEDVNAASFTKRFYRLSFP